MKKLRMLLLTATMAIAVTACGGDKKTDEDYSEFIWPDSEIAQLLPIPKSNVGDIIVDRADCFMVDVSNTSKEDYDEYVKNCKENGFDVDYSGGNDYYFADNPDGYSLDLYYDDDNDELSISITEPEEESETDLSESTTEILNENSETDEQPETESAETETPAQESDDIDPEFKEAMDSYEAFFDEYCEFMEKYSETDDTTGMLADYADYMTKYAEMMEKMNAIDQDELSTAETAYYVEVTTRITQKLAEVAQ